MAYTPKYEKALTQEELDLAKEYGYDPDFRKERRKAGQLTGVNLGASIGGAVGGGVGTFIGGPAGTAIGGGIGTGVGALIGHNVGLAAGFFGSKKQHKQMLTDVLQRGKMAQKRKDVAMKTAIQKDVKAKGTTARGQQKMAPIIDYNDADIMAMSAQPDDPLLSQTDVALRRRYS